LHVDSSRPLRKERSLPSGVLSCMPVEGSPWGKPETCGDRGGRYDWIRLASQVPIKIAPRRQNQRELKLNQELNRRSHVITDGDAGAPRRAQLRAVNFKDGDWDKPIVGVLNLHSTMNPCNAGIQ